MPKNEINQVSSAKLEPLKQYLYEMKISSFSKKEEKNSAVKVFWQSDKTTPELKLIFMIIDKILLDPCFDRLRTDQQLGYVVFRYSANYYYF